MKRNAIGLVQRIRALYRPKQPAILMYHRVAELTEDPWGLAVSPANFAAQLTLLRRHRSILPLAVFVHRWEIGKLQDDAIAITFDDGYLDNLTHAAPLLAKADAPATLFLATGPMESGSAYWWDTLADQVLHAPPLEETIRISGTDIHFTLGALEPLDHTRNGWRAWEPRTARERLYFDLWNRMRPQTAAESAQTMQSLHSIFGHQKRSTPCAMTPDEVRKLTTAAPFSISNHTVDHLDLVMQDGDVVLRQMRDATARISGLLGEVAPGFTYPYGSHDNTTLAHVQSLSFNFACTTRHGFINAKTDRYAMPRLTAPDTPNIDWLCL